MDPARDERVRGPEVPNEVEDSSSLFTQIVKVPAPALAPVEQFSGLRLTKYFRTSLTS